MGHFLRRYQSRPSGERFASELADQSVSPTGSRLQCCGLAGELMRTKISAGLMFVFVLVFVLVSVLLHAQQATLSKTVQKYVRVNAPKIILEHVRVIDGTGKLAV